MHPSDSALRRSIDEPVALDPRERRHLVTCSRCAKRARAMQTDAARAFAVFATPDPSIDVAAARARLAETETSLRSAAAPTRSNLRGIPRGVRSARASRVLVGVAVAALASVVVVVSGGAQDFLSLFQPKQFAAVAVTTADIRSLAGLASYGSINGGSSPLRVTPEPDAASAAQAAGLPAPKVADLPSGTAAAPTYAVIAGTTVSFTFDAALARAAASRAGGQLPAMPRGLDGSTLTVAIEPAVVVSYGLDLATLYQGGALPSGGTALVVVASRTPTVSSTGVTVQQLENYMLSLPGIPSGVVAELRAIGDPAQTVPVPIPVDLANASTVDVNGARGLLIGDSTQLGSVLLWQHKGVVYAVAGTLSSDQVLGIARTLH
jgi:anti-sigma factor RsiW